MHELRVRRIDLIGGGRSIDFTGDFSVVKGSITTGKTTIVRLLRALLGRVPGHLPPETGDVRSVRGRVDFGSETWEIDRPLVTTKTAIVSLSRRETVLVAGSDQAVDAEPTEVIIDALRLPAEVATSTEPSTYLNWLLSKLGIPAIAVPRARTDVTSAPSPVTVNDWLLYCIVRDDEIDTSVFGHRDQFVDRKRRAVFELNYEIYNEEAALLQAQLRSIELRLAELDQSNDAIRAFLKDTPFGSLDNIDQRIVETTAARGVLDARVLESAEAVRTESQSVNLRATLVSLDERRASSEAILRSTQRSLGELEDLKATLSAQSQRLVRAIVADEWLVDFDFLVCPRCGTGVVSERTDAGHCYLCLQEPQQEGFHDELIEEQERVASQIVETQELIELRRAELVELEYSAAGLRREAANVSDQLDRVTRTFVSRQAESMLADASERARLEATLQTLADYRALFVRYSDLQGLRERLENERADVTDALAQHSGRSARTEQLLAALEERFLEYLRRLHISLSDLPLTATINRTTYLPEVSGRPFDELSSQGLTVLVNVAHALAHHTVSIDHGLSLPGLLVLDGLSNNVGHEGFDLERRDDTYRLLIEEVERYDGRLQVIALDNDVPDFAASEVVLTLSPDDRLIRRPEPVVAGGSNDEDE
jgi:hypothetical protein